MSKEKTNIQFTSISMLKLLEKKYLLKHLRRVLKDETGYPVYLFRDDKKVVENMTLFMTDNHLKCDRSIDGDEWKYYKENILKVKELPELSVTRNYKVVHRIFEEGYASMLCKVGVDQYKKKFFVFYKNDTIASIKSEEDAKRKLRYEKKQHEKTAEMPNTEIGKLIEKAMEDKKDE